MFMTRWLRRGPLSVAVCAVLLPFGIAAHDALAQSLVVEQRALASALTEQAGETQLPGHVLGVLGQATPVTLTPRAAAEAASQAMTLTLVLNLTDRAGFDAYTRAVYDPQSPTFQQFLSQADITRRFGPSQQAYDAVLAYLTQNGFTLVDGSANRLTITVQGTREQAERAFHAQIRDYELNGRRFYANSVDPAVPTALAPLIQAIVGLDNLARPRPALAPAAPLEVPPESPLEAPEDAPPTPATPMSIANAYNFQGVLIAPNTPANGAGQMIGLLEFDAFFPSDIQSWLQQLGPCTATATQAQCVNNFLGRVTVVPVNGAVTPGGGETEVILDLVTVMGMAQGASYRVYESCNGCPQSFSFQAMINRMVGDGVFIISNSWSNCENQVSSASALSLGTVVQNAAAIGVSVFSATGDNGPFCPVSNNQFAPNVINFPSDVPYGIAVGGTTLQVSATNAYQSENWWGNSSTNCPKQGCGTYGNSVFFTAPPWQGLPAGAPRSVPDVVADADPNSGILLFQADAGPPQPFGEGGTSMATPIWAAGTALINQARGAPSGNFVQLVYSLRNTTAFHSPASMTPPNNDFTHLGVGSFNLGALAGQLLPSCSPRPNVGVSVVQAGGGVLQVTITANNSAGTATNLGGNQLSSLQFGATTNGLVVTSSTPNGSPGNFTLSLPAGTTQTSFTVRPSVAGQPVTVPLVVTDACGPWSTFVGQGAALSGSGGAPTSGNPSPAANAGAGPAGEPAASAARTPTPQPPSARSAAAALSPSVTSSVPSPNVYGPAPPGAGGSAPLPNAYGPGAWPSLHAPQAPPIPQAPSYWWYGLWDAWWPWWWR
jgi:subtilase family serine protease